MISGVCTHEIQACAHVNISRTGRIQRAVAGALLIVIAIILSLVLLFLDISRWYRLLTWPFWCGGVLCALQAKGKVCVKLAWTEKSSSSDELQEQFRRRALRKRAACIIIASFAFATIVVAGLLLIPPQFWD